METKSEEVVLKVIESVAVVTVFENVAATQLIANKQLDNEKDQIHVDHLEGKTQAIDDGMFDHERGWMKLDTRYYIPMEEQEPLERREPHKSQL